MSLPMSPAPAAKDPARTPTLPAWAAPAAWAIALGAIAVGLGVWVPRLVDQVASRSLPAPVRVVLRELPPWLPADERTAIERTVLRSMAESPFDRDGLVRAREAVSMCGWMPEVTQVHRRDVDEVVVEGTWAVPIALVCDADGEHLIDTRGRRLPRTYPAGKGPRLVRIGGVSMPRPAEFGARWEGAEVDAALRMAALVAERPWRHQLARIDVSGFASSGTVSLVTDGGCTIAWGRSPGDESAAEVPAMQKLAALQLAYDRTGRIDGGSRATMDLRGDFTLAR